MLQSISWTEYLTAVAVILILYYLYVAVRYFQGDIKDLLGGKRKLSFRTALAVPGENGEPKIIEEQETHGAFEQAKDNEFAEVEHLIGRLKTAIADASRRKLIAQEFKQYLSMVLKEYPSVKYSPLRSSINELIISECQKYGAVTLREEEAELLWKEAV
ncbi:MAG: hypothetical protein JST70_16830 [Bacteroidetes bacterium]|nr:hypothetical protein [Bacteroidota bacterium]